MIHTTKRKPRFFALTMPIVILFTLVWGTPASAAGSSVVKVIGTQGNWQLTVNGQPYIVKGADFGPSTKSTSSVLDNYTRDMASLGMNTTRTWGTGADTANLLASVNKVGIRVVMGHWLSQSADYANDSTYKNTTLNNIKRQVSKYKDDPGVLMWDVGNEVILFLQNTYSGAQLEAERVAYAKYIEQVTQAIHAIDPNHPVTSTDAWTGAWPYYKANTPSLDLYAVNSYGSACNVQQDWVNGAYTKPYILTEWGNAGEWEVPNDSNGVPTEPSDIQKRDAYPAVWNCITNAAGVALGGTLFIYGDKEDFGGIWFNLLQAGGLHRLTYYSVKQMYTGNPITENTPPQIQGITLSKTSGIPKGGTFTVTVSAYDPNGDPISYQLKLCSKYINGSVSITNATYTQTSPGVFTVTAPSTSGVWKLYVYANDGKGNIGIDTRSFGVQ